MSSKLNLIFAGVECIKALSDISKPREQQSTRKSDTQIQFETAFNSLGHITNTLVGKVKDWMPSLETKDGKVEKVGNHVALTPNSVMVSMPGVMLANISLKLVSDSLIINISDYKNPNVNPFSVPEKIEVPIKHIVDKIDTNSVSLKNGCLIIPINNDKTAESVTINITG